jgi:hypothetical protein
MASTYVNDLRLNELGTGDGSGTWGTTTNTNLELIAEGLSFGTEAITTNADTHTSTVADGATDPARSIYIKYTGTLDSACTITIAPNTLSRLHFIENGTSGSQNIIISQGSGANVTIPPGDVKVVYLDGAGSGAAVVDAFASLSVVDLKVQDDLTVTDDMTVGGTLGVTGVLTATSLDISGDIDVDGTTNLDVVDIDGAVDMASTLTVAGAVTGSSSFATAAGGTFTTASGNDLNLVYPDGRSLFFKEAGTTTLTLDNAQGATFAAGATFADGCTITTADNSAQLTLISTDADANAGPKLLLTRDSGSPADSDTTGEISFNADDSAGNITEIAKIESSIIDVTNTEEDGRLLVRTMTAGTATSRLDFTNTETVFNDSSIDVDFRVESDGNANMFFVDAGNDKIGIGTNSGSGSGQVTIRGAGSTRQLVITDDDAERLQIYHVGNDSTIESSSSGSNSTNLIFKTSSSGTESEAFRVDSSQNLLIGKTADNVATVGIEARATGPLISTRDGSDALRLNRLNSDGEIIQIRKDGATAGSIGTVAGDIFISNAVDVGLYFESTTTDHIAPCNIDGSKRHAAIDMGSSGTSFKNYYGVQYMGAGGHTGYMHFTGSHSIRFVTNGTEAARFEASGHLQIGQTSSTTPGSGGNTTAGSTLRSVGDAYFSRDGDIALYLSRNGSDGKIASFARGGGEVGSISVASSSTTYTTSSDRRLKSNIEDAASASDKIDAIQVRQFDWNVDDSHQDYGLIAQELQPIEPLAVTGDADSDEMMAVDYSKLVPMLIKEIQELRSRVATLEAS